MTNNKARLFPILLLTGPLFAVPLAGCINSSGAAQSGMYTTVSSGTAYGIENQQFHVVETATQYSVLLSGVTLSGNIPSPDFSTVTLIAAFTGYKSDCETQASLNVFNVVDSTGSVAVTLQQIEPGGVCLASLPSSGPYVFVEIHRTSKPISFIVNVP